MKYFITGASGWIGSALTTELISQGHKVLALARSEASANHLTSLGAEVLRGDMDDAEILKKGAAQSDGVAHLASKFSTEVRAGQPVDFKDWAKADRATISALGEALKGTGKPLAVASGSLVVDPGVLGTEDSTPNTVTPLAILRGPSETLTLGLEDVRAMVIRLAPTVHGKGDLGFIHMLSENAKTKGFAGYVDDGANVWPAVHRVDAARLFILALQKGRAGTVYHAIAEGGVRLRDIQEAVAEKNGLSAKSITKEEAHEVFTGFLVHVIVAHNPMSAEKTKAELGWSPKEPGLLDDIRNAY